MKICTVNFDSAWLNTAENLSRMEADIASVLEIQNDVDTVVFPELNTTGYVIESSLKEVASYKNGQQTNAIKSLSKKFKVNIIGGFIEEENGIFYNAAFVVNKN